MLTMAAPSGTGGTPAAVTDGGGGADMRRASNRYARQTGRPISSLMPYRKIIMSAGARSGNGARRPVEPIRRAQGSAFL
jgi:hypothetical protein